ncbi:CAP domain-containing protein [Arcanobacterium canis]|uniref:CAP domain-containing protein n=1 Tax=Arcanobacterium canis TaxID=999183 RepID=A0ABY8G067_9ACTO|nr:CAP domain-containing protein [Arcanobacterium canis]WFM83205.1 CAP domain-containing protein [Arcanobacterium canis]
MARNKTLTTAAALGAGVVMLAPLTAQAAPNANNAGKERVVSPALSQTPDKLTIKTAKNVTTSAPSAAAQTTADDATSKSEPTRAELEKALEEAQVAQAAAQARYDSAVKNSAKTAKEAEQADSALKIAAENQKKLAAAVPTTEQLNSAKKSAQDAAHALETKKTELGQAAKDAAKADELAKIAHKEQNTLATLTNEQKSAQQAQAAARAEAEKAKAKADTTAATTDKLARAAEAAKAQMNDAVAKAGPNGGRAAANAVSVEEAKAQVAKAQAALELSKSAAQNQLAQGSLGFFKERAKAGINSAAQAVKVLTVDTTAKNDGTRMLQFTDIGAKGDATSLENMRYSFELIERSNNKRVSGGGRAGENLKPLLVDDYLTAVSQLNANWSANHKWDHAFPSAWKGTENLSRRQPNPAGAVGYWYDHEKEIYDGLAAKNPRLNQLSFLDIYRSFPRDFPHIGHYLNIVDPAHNATGAAYSQGPSYHIMGQNNGKSSSAVPLSQYKKEFETYYSRVTNAAKNGSLEARAALDTAQKALANAQSGQTPESKNLERVRAAFAQAVKERDAAAQISKKAAAEAATAQKKAEAAATRAEHAAAAVVAQEKVARAATEAAATAAQSSAHITAQLAPLDAEAKRTAAEFAKLNDAVVASKAADSELERRTQSAQNAATKAQAAKAALEEAQSTLTKANAMLKAAQTAVDNAPEPEAHPEVAPYADSTQVVAAVAKGEAKMVGEGKVTQGKPAVFTFTNLAPNTKADVYFYSTPILVASGVANADGVLRIGMDTSVSTPAGIHYLVARSQAEGAPTSVYKLTVVDVSAAKAVDKAAKERTQHPHGGTQPINPRTQKNQKHSDPAGGRESEKRVAKETEPTPTVPTPMQVAQRASSEDLAYTGASNLQAMSLGIVAASTGLGIIASRKRTIRKEK